MIREKGGLRKQQDRREWDELIWKKRVKMMTGEVVEKKEGSGVKGRKER